MLHRHHQQEPRQNRYQWLLQHHHQQQTVVVRHPPNMKKKKCTSSGTTALTSARSGRKSASASTASFPTANGAGFRASSANSTASSVTRSVRHCASRDWCVMESFCAREAHWKQIIMIITPLFQRSVRPSLASSNGWVCGIRGWGRIQIKLIWWWGGYLPEFFFLVAWKIDLFKNLQDIISFLPSFSALSPFTILPAGLAAGKPITGRKFLSIQSRSTLFTCRHHRNQLQSKYFVCQCSELWRVGWQWEHQAAYLWYCGRNKHQVYNN